MTKPDRQYTESERAARAVLSEFGYQWVSSLELSMMGYVDQINPAKRAYSLLTQQDQRKMSPEFFQNQLEVLVGGRLHSFNVTDVSEQSPIEVLGQTYALIDSATIATPTNARRFTFPVLHEANGWRVAFLRGLETVR